MPNTQNFAPISAKFCVLTSSSNNANLFGIISDLISPNKIMNISRKTDYGLILIGALKHTHASGEFVSLKSITKQYRLPYAYLEKLAGILKKAGVVDAHVGKGGGYKLAHDPKNISVQEIIDVFQSQPMMRCLHAANPEKTCTLISVCPTRKGWRRVDLELKKTLRKFSVAQL